MTEVLSISAQLSGSSLFGSHPLRRSSSQTSFLLQSSTIYSTSPSDPRSGFANPRRESRISTSQPSSAPSSPRLLSTVSSQPSYTATPSSSLSLDQQGKTEEEDILFPSYDNDDDHDDDEYSLEDIEDLEPELDRSSSPNQTSPKNVTSSFSDNLLQSQSRQETSTSRAKAGDDTAVKAEPTKHVDYLSHNWTEEDVWSTWRHLVAKRKVYANASRLENAAWRAWTKSKYQLKTVLPEKLNWMKDHDVTWLYGPLQTGFIKSFELDFTPPASQLSRSNSFTSKKPILKKRTLSELMLQRSLSSSTLMKQATDAIRAQQPEEHINDSSVINDHVLVKSSTLGSPCLKLTTAPPISIPSGSSSGAQTPSAKRRIHFNNKVEQCIAINKCRAHHGFYNAIDEDSSSEDDMLMMKPVPNNRAKLSNRSTPRSSFSSESKTIAMLPSTTLNYRGDTPDSHKSIPKQNGLTWHAPPKPSLSCSRETLKPTTSSIKSTSRQQESIEKRSPPFNFLMDDEYEDMDMSWEPLVNRCEDLYAHEPGNSNSSTGSEQTSGLHQTPSGMFMPSEVNNGSLIAAGILGKVYSTVTTAKDIAHIVWNVGWRK